MLLSAGVDKNKPRNQQASNAAGLMKQPKEGHREIVQLLVDAGADTTITVRHVA